MKQNQIPAYLRKWRTDMGDARPLYQEEAANILGVSARTWKRMESGHYGAKNWLIPALEWLRENKDK